MTPEEMQDRLRESGIDSELVTYPNPKAVGVKWQANGIVWTYDWYGQTPQALSTYMHYLPEQAIAATVGVEETYTREECEAQFVRGFSLGSLPSGSDPQWDENRQTLEEHMAELGWVRRDAATVGAGTCHMEVCDNLDESEGMGDVWLECDECHWQMPLEPTTPRFNYCPNCGKRIEVSDV